MLYIFISMLIAFTLSMLPQDTDVNIGQISRPFAEVTDPEMIEFFLDQFLIPESDVTKLEIIDVTANGFGPDDIVVTYPSMRAYIVEEPSEASLHVMRNWSLEDYRIDSDNVDPDLFDPEITGNLENAAQNAIIADMLRTLNRNYSQLPIRMRLERDENGFTFEMWDFDEDAMDFTPNPPPAPNNAVSVDHLISELIEYRDVAVPEYQHTYDQIIRDLIEYRDAPDADTIITYEQIIRDLVEYRDAPVTDSIFTYNPPFRDLAEYRDDIVTDSLLTYDLLYLSQSDTVVIAGHNLYDVIYFSKTVEDTVFLPVPNPSTERAGN